MTIKNKQIRSMKLSIVLCMFTSFLTTILLVNCKKKENTATSNAAPTTTPTCFNAQYNGTYVGSGYTSTPFTAGTLTISKTNCQTININLYTNTGGGISTQASQLIINGTNSYEGKLSNGNNITLTGGGNHMYVNAINTFTFNGDK